MGSSPTPTRQNQNQAAKIKIQKFAKRNQNQGVVLSLFLHLCLHMPLSEFLSSCMGRRWYDSWIHAHNSHVRLKAEIFNIASFFDSIFDSDIADIPRLYSFCLLLVGLLVVSLKPGVLHRAQCYTRGPPSSTPKLHAGGQPFMSVAA